MFALNDGEFMWRQRAYLLDNLLDREHPSAGAACDPGPLRRGPAARNRLPGRCRSARLRAGTAILRTRWRGSRASRAFPDPPPSFPVNRMFWARPAALAPLFDLGLDWSDYPAEPLPYDGSCTPSNRAPAADRHRAHRLPSRRRLCSRIDTMNAACSVASRSFDREGGEQHMGVGLPNAPGKLCVCFQSDGDRPTYMRCLILGGGGFIGSFFADRLLILGHAVRIFERPRVLPYRAFGREEPVEWFAGDFQSAATLRRRSKTATWCSIWFRPRCRRIPTTTPSTTSRPTSLARLGCLPRRYGVRLRKSCSSVGRHRLRRTQSDPCLRGESHRTARVLWHRQARD